ncbi:MAG: MGMT family protein [Methanimicrococcus sp.]|nr:MGMT family protein [Methanimicrococcus sp.]
MSEKKRNDEKYQEVYFIVSNVPPGKVATYGQIAAMVGGLTARQVGFALKTAPSEMKLPAHRIVNAAGKLAPEYVFFGKENQRKRLGKEGITFTDAGNIRIKEHLWK